MRRNLIRKRGGERKAESTDTTGSHVETFNTMVSASGLLQLKTFRLFEWNQIPKKLCLRALKAFHSNLKSGNFLMLGWKFSRSRKKMGKFSFLVLAFLNANTQAHKKVSTFRNYSRENFSNRKQDNSTQMISILMVANVLGGICSGDCSSVVSLVVER